MARARSARGPRLLDGDVLTSGTIGACTVSQGPFGCLAQLGLGPLQMCFFFFDNSRLCLFGCSRVTTLITQMRSSLFTQRLLHGAVWSFPTKTTWYQRPRQPPCLYDVWFRRQMLKETFLNQFKVIATVRKKTISKA